MMSETENKETENKITEEVPEESDEITSENVEEVMSKEEFARILFTDKRFRFVPNKKAILKKIRTMNDEEYENLIRQAFGEMKKKEVNIKHQLVFELVFVFIIKIIH